MTRMATMDAKFSFTAPTEQLSFDGLLFDMDGTIIDSTEAVVKHWHRIGNELGVDPNVILATSHGRRSIDVLRLYEPKLATWEYVKEIEARIPIDFGDSVKELPGSRRILESLTAANAPWGIVTSGTRPFVTGWLNTLGLSHPEHLVVAEDVVHGKPDPAGYISGRTKLGLPETSAILVFEDAPAGVRAGKAAGCRVVALTTTHTVEQLQEAGADWIVRDLDSVVFSRYDNASKQVIVKIQNALLS